MQLVQEVQDNAPQSLVPIRLVGEVADKRFHPGRRLAYVPPKPGNAVVAKQGGEQAISGHEVYRPMAYAPNLPRLNARSCVTPVGVVVEFVLLERNLSWRLCQSFKLTIVNSFRVARFSAVCYNHVKLQ